MKSQPIQVINDLKRERFEKQLDIDIQRRKDAGLWTECDENGHDLLSYDDNGPIECARCGVLATREWLEKLNTAVARQDKAADF